MAPVTFHLVTVANQTSFLETVQAAPLTHRPYYVGRCQHWFHSPKISLGALTGSGPDMQRWNYLIVADAVSEDHLALPPYLRAQVTTAWSITAPVDDTQLSNLAKANQTRASDTPPTLPPGWSPSDPSGLTASNPPPDLEASLGLSAIALGAPKTFPPTPFKTFTRAFATTNPGPVSMFNLVAVHPGQRARFYGYIAAFAASTGSRYGGEAQLLGSGVTDWSSRLAEGLEVADPEAGGSGVWEDVALVWYPSLWHFAKMLDDPDYARADREFKVGVIKDNPILCCTGISLG